MTMDHLKYQVLEMLKNDCRTSLEDMAVMLGVSTQNIASMVDEMEKEQIILRYSPVVNWDKPVCGSDDRSKGYAPERKGL